MARKSIHFRYNSIILLIFALLSAPLSAQTVSDISVEGNYSFQEDDYISWSRVKPGSAIFPSLADSAKKYISLQLARRGYISADAGATKLVYSPDSLTARLVISVDEGRPSVLRNLTVLGVNDVQPFDRRLRELTGSVYSSSRLEELIQSMLDYYENNGFPFAAVHINSILFAKDSSAGMPAEIADVQISVDTGKYARIDMIEVRGSTKTKDYVVLREARLKMGMPYSQKVIEEIPAKVNRLKFFEPVQVPDFYMNSKNQGILSIGIKDRQTNTFDGVIGYVPGESSGKGGYITGLVNISLKNLLGTGRSAAVKWQKIDRNSQELDLRYLEPWLLGYPFNVSLGLYQIKQDTSYVARKVSSAVEFLATGEISASLSLQLESVIPAISAYGLAPKVYNSSLTTTGVNLKVDTRDDIYSPRRGIYFLNSYYFSRKKINGPKEYIQNVEKTDINLQRLEVDFGIYREVFRHQVAAAEFHGRELRGSFTEVSDLYRMGGMRTLRGYLENQFLANRLLWTNLEYRLLLTARSYAFLFSDIGYYLRNADEKNHTSKSSAVKPGYGFGINLETGLGVLGVSYALAKGDQLSDGKIHFGFIGDF